MRAGARAVDGEELGRLADSRDELLEAGYGYGVRRSVVRR
jgi:hypothetical protein